MPAVTTDLSGCACCTAECCGSVPATLNVALTANDCPEVDGINVTITYDGVNDWWYGEAVLACTYCTRVTVKLQCINGTHYVVTLGFRQEPVVPGPGCFTDGPATSTCDPEYTTLVSCSPFELDFRKLMAIIDTVGSCCYAFCLYITGEITP